MTADKTEYLTKEKYEELRKELEHLKTDKRREIAENLEYAKSLGDLSENAEYHEARSDQANLEDRIAKLEIMLKTAVIVSLDKHTEVIGIGSTVTIQKEKDKGESIYKIVGSEEADLNSGKLSLHSPLGEALLGKNKGELVSVTTPKGLINYKISAIK